MSNVAILVHLHSAQAARTAAELSRDLEQNGHSVTDISSALSQSGGARTPEIDEMVSGAAILVVLGGDGSMLSAINVAAPLQVPVIGANFGYMGYLTETQPETLLTHIYSALAGESAIEKRMRITVSVTKKSGQGTTIGEALNEALVERSDSGRTIRLGVAIDGADFITYNADGIMVASPTGSTAYSLSARGPIMDPTHRAMIINAVSPHQLFDRAIVVGYDSKVEINVLPDRHASLCLDGRTICNLEPGDRIECEASNRPALIVKGSRDHFLTVLKNKFGLDG